MQTQQSILWFAALAVAVGCGKTTLPLKPEIQPGPPPIAQSPLQALRGSYRLVDVDGDVVDSGSLTVEDGELGLGVRYTATVSGTTYERSVLTPASLTEFTTESGRLHQKYQEGDRKITLDYDSSGGALTIEVAECKPGVCLVTVLSAEAIN